MLETNAATVAPVGVMLGALLGGLWLLRPALVTVSISARRSSLVSRHYLSCTGSEDKERKQRADHERIATTNRGYKRVGKDDCGRVELAGKSIAVPFVGAFAGALVVAELPRLAHDGAAFTDMKIRLGAMGNRIIRVAKTYEANDLAGITFSEAIRLP